MTGPAHLLDTNAAIDLLADPACAATLGTAPTAVSALTEIEVRRGVAVRAHDPAAVVQRVDLLNGLLTRWSPIPVDARVAAAYSRVVAAVVASGQQPRPRVVDHLIAATALAHGLTLVTADRTLLNGVAGLVPTTSLP
ncbi:type II toxin-antitoxin system VapC family toxin [Kineococcus arenarius]|uniref:type II toxin-antitoxin system VapC family toxin n=1 Tax=unclassified Kineococcus TaxID=2621656 RepID=UPI003D7CA4AD